MVGAVVGLPEDVMPVQQIEQAVYARVIAHKLGQDHAKTRSVVDEDHRKSLSTLMSSPHIVGGGLSEESREWPPNQRAQKSSPKLCRLIDILALPFHARHAADPQERTQILRAQPHRSVGALVDEIQEQHT